ncbi:unnamed protein product [Tuber aestivum]|uniref:Uncharacterized protein n=1 Tax=Tuber aestivum TaxID=59557 RepID=A0A292Q4D9_9PEZI|nr:unnamed protein product [Tuber aestivum]
MFSASALSAPLEPEVQEFCGCLYPPSFEQALPVDYGQPCSFENPSLLPPCEEEKYIVLSVPFLKREPGQDPLSQEICADLLDEFAATYQQLRDCVCNNYWAETPVDPKLSDSGAKYDQSSYNNRGGNGNAFFDPSGRRARSGCVNIHLPGEEVGDLAFPEIIRVKKRSLRGPPDTGCGGAEPFKRRRGQGVPMQVAQPKPMDPSISLGRKPFRDGHGDLRELPGHKQSPREPHRESYRESYREPYRGPHREPHPHGYTKETPRPIPKHPWPEPREPPARKPVAPKPPGQRVAEVTITQTLTVTVTKHPRDPPSRTVCVPITLTVDVTKTITLSSRLPAETVTTTQVITPTELPEKLSRLDGRLRELGDGLKRFDPGN